MATTQTVSIQINPTAQFTAIQNQTQANATAAANSATAAAGSATAASNSNSSVQAMLATFRSIFLGSFATDANAVSFATANSIALVSGVMYDNTTENKFRIYSGSAWADYDATATASQNSAQLSATNAANSASAAAGSASAASTSAGNASTSATNASNSATTAANAATAASNSATAAANSAATIGFTLSSNNTWTGAQTFAGGGSIAIKNGSNPAFTIAQNAAGAVVITNNVSTRDFTLSQSGTTNRLYLKNNGKSSIFTDGANALNVGYPGVASGKIILWGTTSGDTTIQAPDAGAGNTIMLPTAAGTLVSSAATPLSINATSGQISLGNIPVSLLNSGTGATNATFWRGDGNWAGIAVANVSGAAPLASPSFTSLVNIDGTASAPLNLKVSTAAADQTTSRLYADVSSLRLQLVNDAYSASTDILAATRSGYALSSLALAGGVLTLTPSSVKSTQTLGAADNSTNVATTAFVQTTLTTLNGSNITSGTINAARLPATYLNAASNLSDLSNPSAAIATLGLTGASNQSGAIGLFAMQTPPPGWIVCDGSALSRTTYAALYAAIGTTWGAGDGSTTFNIPDFRGAFLRGWDSGRGLDPSRVFASYQTDKMAGHVHTLNGNIMIANQASSAYGGGLNTPGAAYTKVGDLNDTGAGTNTGSTGSNETAPKNYAILICIRY